jgi:hypothetical protein
LSMLLSIRRNTLKPTGNGGETAGVENNRLFRSTTHSEESATNAANMRRLIILLVVTVALPAAAVAANNTVNRYESRSDEELTVLAADWDSLDRHQRRALLTEMKLRMARNGKRNPVIHIRTERRYGRLIRQSDGRVIRIETQVVHVRPVDPEDLKARQSFGVGFEQRVARREEQDLTPSGAQAAGATEPAVVGDEATLESVLESLAPSTQAPVVNRLPIYQASDPKR